MPFEILRIELLEKATPIFFALIALEALVGWAMGKRIARWNDSLTSIATSVVMEVTGLFLNWLMLAVFIAISLHASIPALIGHWLFAHGQPLRLGRRPERRLAATRVLGHGVRRRRCCVLLVPPLGAHRQSIVGEPRRAHSSEDYNLSVGLRHSSIENLFSALFYLPMAFFGVPWEMFLLCYVLNLFYMFWVHTELIGKLPRWFEFVFSTPSHHRVHHARDPKYIDRNFGGTIHLLGPSLWHVPRGRRAPQLRDYHATDDVQPHCRQSALLPRYATQPSANETPARHLELPLAGAGLVAG